MNLSSKLALENNIFARAAVLQTAVHSCQGKLVSWSKDACLQALLKVYNAYFYRENFSQYAALENPLDAFEQFKQICAGSVSHTPVLAFTFTEFLF